MITISTIPGDTLFYAGARDHVVLFIVISTNDERGDLSSLRAMLSGDMYMHVTK